MSDLNTLQTLHLPTLRSRLPEGSDGVRAWTAELDYLLSPVHIEEFRYFKTKKMQDFLQFDVSRRGHFIFLSHYWANYDWSIFGSNKDCCSRCFLMFVC